MRARTKTHDDATRLVPEPLTEVTMDGFLSCSFPGAAPPPRNRPEPPRAPLRKPSDVSWEVPPYQLPVAPKKRSLSADMSADCSGTTEESPPILEEDAEKSEDEDDDAGIFALDGGAASDDDEFELGDAFQLAGFDDGDDDDFVGALITSERKFSTGGYLGDKDGEKMSKSLPAAPVCRLRTESQNVELGASPILLSVLEQVAAAQASQRPGGRCRADSC